MIKIINKLKKKESKNRLLNPKVFINKYINLKIDIIGF